MYKTGQKYKIQLKNKDSSKPIIYTAEILEEDSLQIQIRDVKGEEIVLNKDEIRQSKLIQYNTGVEDVKNS